MKGLLRHNIVVYHSPTMDGSGRKTWATLVRVTGRFIKKAKQVLSEQGEMTVADSQVQLINQNNELDNVVVGDKVEYNNQAYHILQINEATHANGRHHHFTFTLQRWT